MSITLNQARKLAYNDVVVNAAGKRFYVKGAVKTWKRDKGRIRVPLKHGLYAYGYLSNNTWESGKHFNLDISEVDIEV